MRCSELLGGKAEQECFIITITITSWATSQAFHEVQACVPGQTVLCDFAAVWQWLKGHGSFPVSPPWYEAGLSPVHQVPVQYFSDHAWPGQELRFPVKRGGGGKLPVSVLDLQFLVASGGRGEESGYIT